MEQYEVEEIEVPDELAQEFEISTLSSDNLVKVIEQLGYTPEEARNLVSNTQATAINDLTAYRLYEVFKSGNISLLPTVLKNVKPEVVYIDDCQLLFLRLPTTPPLDENRINWIREKLGQYYPDKLQSYTITITNTDGKQIRLSTFNILQSRQFDQLFELYRQWFDHQSRWIGPKYDRIEKSLGDWLRREVTKGIRPQQDEFIYWFVTNKLAVLSLNFQFTVDKESGYVTPGSVVPVRLKIQNLAEYFTPDVIEEDYIRFGLWKLEQVENITGRMLAAKRALTPKVNNVLQRKEATHRKARQAVTQYERLISEIVQREKGKNFPQSIDEIVKEAIQKYLLLVGLNLANTERGLTRYLNDIGKTQTALQYGRQLVGQLKQRM